MTLEEYCKNTNNIQEDVLKLRIENEQLKAQIEKMKCPQNCKDFGDCIYSRCPCEKWELRK